MQAQLKAQPRVAIRRVYALINPASGGTGPGMADELATLFCQIGLDHAVSQLTPGQFETTVLAAIATCPDLIVVLGGDGTQRLVGELCGPAGPLIAPLSGGTMSKLSRALYGPRPWREALEDALWNGAPHWAPGGEVDGRAFYCSAVLGSPALWARAREAIRAHKLGRAWRRAAIASRNAFVGGLRYRLDGYEGRGLALSFICPTVSRAMGADAGALETAVLNVRNTKAGVRLALNKLFGDWRDDPGVTVRPSVSGLAWSRRRIPAMLDGEFFLFGRQVDVRFRPHAFRALVAPAAPGCASG